MRQNSGSNMILEDVVAFLKKVPPFQFLDDTDLQTVARNLSMEFYPRGMVILKQDGPPSDALRIIKKGGIKVSMVSEDGDLQAVARNLSMEFYPRDMVILRQDGPPSDSLRIIKKGGIKVSMVPEDGNEVVIDYRGEGDTFGFLSMVG